MERANGSRPAKAYRGSRRRVRRIKWRGNDSWELWVLILWVAFLLLVVVPWMMSQPLTTRWGSFAGSRRECFKHRAPQARFTNRM